MTRGHWLIVAIWVGSPIALWLTLNFLSPGYMRDFYNPITPFFGLFLLLVGLNIVFLMFGFAIYTNHRRKKKLKVEEMAEKPKMPFLMSFFLFLLFLCCTLPSLWLALMGPAASRLMIEFLSAT